MTDTQAMHAIQDLLDGTNYNTKMLDAIAEICRRAGYDVRTLRQRCEAEGWRYYEDNEVLREWCGEGDGIAHAPTVEEREGFNDTVYVTWEACWREAVEPNEAVGFR
jgi:hypothetical protein